MMQARKELPPLDPRNVAKQVNDYVTHVSRLRGWQGENLSNLSTKGGDEDRGHQAVRSWLLALRAKKVHCFAAASLLAHALTLSYTHVSML
jgi:hypothetical protein